MLFKKQIIQEKISDEVNRKERVKRYFFLIVGCFLLAVAFNMFFSPNNLQFSYIFIQRAYSQPGLPRCHS